MNIIRLLTTVIIAVGLHLSAASATPFAGESLNYRVMYKWGLVNKQAGRVNIRTIDKGDTFNSVLTARTEKWADKFYEVRDTLLGTLNALTLEPSCYDKITHEGGKYKRDQITYQRSGNSVSGHCVRTRQKKSDSPLTKTEITLTSTGLTLDMLSAFYYMRSINYPSMTSGQKKTLTVFSGKRKETLTITYLGKTTIEIDDQQRPCYHITFRFTGEGGKKTSDDMDAWISTDASHIPLKLEGKLPVGKVQCFYTGS